MKKKLFVCGAVLALCSFTLPASATDGYGTPVSTWQGVIDHIDGGVALIQNISAPAGASALVLEDNSAAINFGTANLYGSGTSTVVNCNGYSLLLLGIPGGPGISIISNVGSQDATISNNGVNQTTLTLSNVIIDGGINQVDTTEVPNANIILITNGTDLDIDGNAQPSGVTFTGNSGNISGGKLQFGPYHAASALGTDITLTVAGSAIGAGVGFDISAGNTLLITNDTTKSSSGSVTLNGNDLEEGDNWAVDTWAGNIVLTGTGNLTLSDMTHVTTSTAGYTQNGGTLTLQNSSSLTLGVGGSITGGNVTINDSTFIVNNGLSSVSHPNGVANIINNAAVTMTPGSGGTFTISNDANGNATGFGLNSGGTIGSGNTVNIGNLDYQNFLNVNTGAIIDSGAKVNINGENSLNLMGGTVTLDSTDSWVGNVSVQEGTLNLSGVTQSTLSGGYAQTGGTLNLQNASSLTLNNLDSITTGAQVTTTEAAITAVNIGTTAGADGSSLTLNGGSTLQVAIPGQILAVEIGTSGANASTGNSLNINDYATLDSSASVNINAGNTLNVAGGTATLNNTAGDLKTKDTWSGTVNVAGGNLTLDNITHDTANGAYSQTSGTLNLTNGSALTIGATDTLNDTVYASEINIGSSASDTGNSLTINGGTITSTGDGVAINIGNSTNSGNTLTLAGGTIDSSVGLGINANNTFNITGGTATMHTTDNWGGAINVTGMGSLIVDQFGTAGTPSVLYTQTGANTSLTLSNYSYLTLGVGSAINSGSVLAPGGNSVLRIAGATIAEDAVLTVPVGDGGGMQITAGSVVINGATGSYVADSWDNAGMLFLSGTGTLTLDNLTHEATNGVDGATYLQTDGTLNLTNGTNFTMDSDTVITTSSTGTATVNIGGGAAASTLALNGATMTNTGTGTTNVNVGNGSNGNFLNVQDASSSITNGATGTTTVNVGVGASQNNTLALSAGSITGTGTTVNIGTTATGSTGNNLTVSGTGLLDPTAVVVINAGNSLVVEGGTATLNENGTGIDTWTGAVNLSGGTLNLDSIVEHGSFTQTGGQINIQDTAVRAAHTNILTRAHNLNGGDITLGNNGHLTMQSGDTWTTTNVLTSGGKMTLDGFSHDATAGGTYEQITGTLELANGSTLKLGEQSGIIGGNVLYTGTGNTLNIAEYSVFDSTAIIDITAGNTFTVSGGIAKLSGRGSSPDTWNSLGSVNVFGGNLDLDGITSNGIFSISGGTMRIASDSTLTYNSLCNIGGGNIVNNGTLNLSNDLAKTVFTNLTGAGTVNKNGIGTTTFMSNSIGFTGVYNQTAGKSIITEMGGSFFQNATKNLIGGSVDIMDTTALTLKSTDSWTNTNISNDGLFTLIGVSHDTTTTGSYNQTGGGLVLKNGSNLKLGTGSSITGGTILYLGTGNNLDISTGATLDPTFAIDIIADNKFSVSGGNATLNATGVSQTLDTWAGEVNVSAGNLAINGFTSHGDYNQTGGITTLGEGTELTLDLDSAHTSLSGGKLVINDSTVNLETTNGATVVTSLSGNKAGIINKEGAGKLLLTGQNLGFTGDLYVKGGDVDFNADSGLRDSYISGITHLANGSSLNLSYDRAGLLDSPVELTNGSIVNLDTNGHNIVSLSNNISGSGTLNKTGSGDYWVNAGSNGNFDYSLNVNGGAMNVNADTTANFNAPVSVDSSILRITARETNFDSNLTLSNGYMNILQNGFNVGGNMSVGSTVNTMNGVVATNNIAGDLNVGGSGTAHYLIDISPETGKSDNYIIGGDITKDPLLSKGTIDVSNFRIVGAPTLVNSVNLKVFDLTAGGGSIDSDVDFKATNRTVSTALGQYGLMSQGAGNYTLGWKDFNPQVFRGQVATEAAYANQLTTNGVLFDHINLVSQQFLAGEKPNVYANENPLYAPYQYSQKDGSLWFKGFGNIERLQLSQGINTQNNMWGSLVGADFPIVDLKHGWKVLPTAYVGYTGGYQTYSGVNMYQNGGQGGLMGTFYKGNFINSILANAGGYYNDMSVAGTRDQTGNWFAGLASKSAYNIKLPKDFILQPNMLVSYNAFGSQNWNSDFGGVGLSSGMLNGLNFGPGINLILNKETWSIYATTQLMVNAMNGVTGSIDDVNLPSVKMGSTYVQYGIGATKRIKDRLSMYGQVVFSNGVRTGVGFQGGVQWKF